MQIMITAGSLARTRVVQFSRLQVLGAAAALTIVLLLLSGAVYHFVFLKAVREGWPVVSQVVRLVVRDEIAQRERYVRENLDAMAQRVGEMQARLVQLEAVGERVSGLAGVRPEELRPPASTEPSDVEKARRAGQGGPYVPARTSTFQDIDTQLGRLELAAEHQADLFLLFESRLLERQLQGLLVPSAPPVTDVPPGSGFGFRTDPFTGRSALHTGLDYPADVGTPILAAAGGVVISTETHPAYGRLVELDHGRGLVTRYAHTSRVIVKTGDIVKRGQHIADVGNTGRSTGPHLHFEVLVQGVPQNPARFLAAANASKAVADAKPFANRVTAGATDAGRRSAAGPGRADPADRGQPSAAKAAEASAAAPARAPGAAPAPAGGNAGEAATGAVLD